MKCHKKNEETYVCFLNGKLYGKGLLRYIHELSKDYIVDRKLYGKTKATFTIEEYGEFLKREQADNKTCNSSNDLFNINLEQLSCKYEYLTKSQIKVLWNKAWETHHSQSLECLLKEFDKLVKLMIDFDDARYY